MRPLADISKIYTERENLAAHKFHQRQIMEKAKRRNLVVQYYNWEWKFLDPETGREYFTQAMADDEAILWLNNLSKQEMPGRQD